MSNKLREKIYSMSNSFLPLDMFYNDIENMSKYPSFNKAYAFEDLEKIADFVLDLQSQLAESEKEIASIQALLSENAIDRKAMQEFKVGEDAYDLTDEDARNSLCWEFEELKQQLAEKDKEIERLKVFEKAYYYNQLQASQEDIQKFQQFANQSAININYIAIQELEKVKDRIKHFCEIHSDDYYGVKSQVMGIRQDVFEFIDQQIKQLGSE